MTKMTTFHDALRMSHIAGGVIGLIVFWIPVFARKGSGLHSWSGKTFAWTAYFVAATAAVSCGWALVNPISFTGITRELSESEIANLETNLRFFFSILAVLMTWLVAGLQLGTYSMRTKGIHDAARSRVLVFQYLAGVASFLLVAYGLIQWFDGLGSRAWIAIALGAFGMSDSKKAIGCLTRQRVSGVDPLRADRRWWYTHMECMLGSGIAFHTAFFVFGFSRLFNVRLEGPLAIVPWLIPAAIGVPATFVWIGRYRRKFESDKKLQTC